MPLLGRRDARPDRRSRELVLPGEPAITADDHVLQVDLVVRFDPEVSNEGRPSDGWREQDEWALTTVVVTVLRLTMETLEREVAVTERSRLVGVLDRALAFAPTGSGFAGRVTSLTVRERGVEASRVLVGEGFGVVETAT